MSTRRYFSNFAPQLQLAIQIAATDTSLQIQGTFAGWPTQFPYYATLDYGQSTAEIIKVTSVSGTVAQIDRGQDGSTAIAHAAGGTMDQTVVRLDYDEANAHTTSTGAGIHGVSGDLVGTDDTQTLTNKTLTNPVINGGELSSMADVQTDTLEVSGTATFNGAVVANAGVTLDAATVSGDLNLTGSLIGNKPQTVTDWNSATTPGHYFGAATAANAPKAAIFSGQVYGDPGGTEICQMLTLLSASAANSPEVWVRQYTGATWGTWHQVYEVGTGWVNVTNLESNWSQDSTPLQVRRIGDEVEFAGGLTDSIFSTTAYQTAATLPAGFAPVRTFAFPLTCPTGAARGGRILTTGEIQFFGSPASSTSYRLDNVRYRQS